MDKFLLKIKFQDKNWKSYEFVLNDCEKKEVLHKDLKPADSSFSFSLLPDIELNNLLLGIGECDTPAQVFRNDDPYFFGYIKKNFSILKEQRLKPVQIELVSPGYLLKDKVGRDVFLKKKKTVTETVKELLELTGTPFKNIPNIPDVLYGVHLKENDTYHKALTDILFEYDYTFNFDAEGNLIFIPLFIEKPQKEYNLTGRDCLEVIELEYKESKKTEVSVEWDGVEIVEDNFAFKETAGAQMGYDCYFELKPESFYKDGEFGVYIPYQSPLGEVVFAENVTLDFKAENDVEVLAFEPMNKKAFIHIKNNNDLFSRRVFKINFKADKVYVKKSKNKSNATRETSNNKSKTLKTKYIYTKVRAENLAHNLLNYYQVTTLSYNVKSKKDIPLGAIVSISDNGIGEGIARIVEKKEIVQDKVFEYVAEMVGDYEPAKQNEEKEILPDPPQKGKDGKDGKQGKDGVSPTFPKEMKLLSLIPSDEKQKEIPENMPAYSKWQNKIIEYDVTNKDKIEMTFEEALNDVIILSGELKNDFTLQLFFDLSNGNGSKSYLIIFKLSDNFNVNIKTKIKNSHFVTKQINPDSLGTGCFCNVDKNANVWAFEGELKKEIVQKLVEKAKEEINEKKDSSLTEMSTKFIEELKNNKQLLQSFVDSLKEEFINLSADEVLRKTGQIGEIRYFTSKKETYGFLYANGEAFNPKDYPDYYEFWLEHFSDETKPNYLGRNADGLPLLPDLRGCSLRAVDDGANKCGAEYALEYQGDAIRNITGEAIFDSGNIINSATGAFKKKVLNSARSWQTKSNWHKTKLELDISEVVPTADDNRVKSYGVYPFIKVI